MASPTTAQPRPLEVDPVTGRRMLPFIKMHGLGNDYVYVNGFEHTVDEPSEVAKAVSDRRFGIGSDGLILAMPASPGVEAHARMRMFNADGSEGEMCGNGIRCVCKLLGDRAIVTANPMLIETGNGVLSLDYTTDERGKVEQVSVDMGTPRYTPEQIPFDASQLEAVDEPHTYRFGLSPNDGGDTFVGTFVNIGNPHVTIYVDDLDAVDLHRVGPKLEHHPAFPQRMNVHFVQIITPSEVRVLHWERGSGPTFACGTGASAVCVAGVLTGRTNRQLLAHLPGGPLSLAWDEATDHVTMTGPATEVFTGIVPV